MTSDPEGLWGELVDGPERACEVPGSAESQCLCDLRTAHLASLQQRTRDLEALLAQVASGRLIRDGDVAKLYDLQDDPRGLVNIADRNKAIVDRMTALLAAGPNPNWHPPISHTRE